MAKKCCGINIQAQRDIFNGNSSSYDPLAKVFFDQLTTQPDASIKEFYNNRIKQSIASGNFAKMDRWWVWGAQYEDNAKVSLVNPTSTNMVKISTPTWTQYQGYTGAVGKALNTKFIPSVDGVNYTQNSACFWFYSRINSAVDLFDGGCADGAGLANESASICKAADNKNYGIINAADGGEGSVAQANTLGLFSYVRTANNATQFWFNGVKVKDDTQVSQGLSTHEFYCLGNNGNGSLLLPSTRQHFARGMGSGAIDQVALFNEINGLATDFGVNVI